MNSNDSNLRSREECEPDENPNPLPRNILVLMGGLFIWGLFYIAYTNLDLDTYETDNDPGTTVESDIEKTDALIDGGVIYQSKCAACHQASGTGVPNVFPPLADSEWVLGDSKILAHILIHGLQGEITVKGITYNNMMPAFGAILSDAEIAAVLTHARSHWGNNAGAVSVDLITKVRAESLENKLPYLGEEALAKLN